VADEQTAGRGRRGHSWLAAPGEDLLFSVLLRPKLELAQTGALTLAIGLALRDAVNQRIAVSAGNQRWPNDLRCERQEARWGAHGVQLQGDRLQAVVVGIGLMLLATNFPKKSPHRHVSSVLVQLGWSENRCSEDILEVIAARLDAYQRTGVAGILSELNTADALRGKRLARRGPARNRRGLDEQGRLLLEDDAATFMLSCRARSSCSEIWRALTSPVS